MLGISTGVQVPGARGISSTVFRQVRFNSGVGGYREAPVTSLQLTYTGVLLAVFGNQLCLPIPSIVFLMAAGAMSADGGMRTSIIVFVGCFGLLGSGWHMVLVRPPVGFSGYATALPVNCRPAKLL